MFGKNQVLGKVDSDKLAVQEIFYTIQGEGPYAGRPAVFIRLAGCNLRCFFCDTDFESNLDNLMSVDSILETAAELVKTSPNADPIVVITGGEPLRQNISFLCYALRQHYSVVQIETAGTLWPEGFDVVAEKVELVCSPKTPNVIPSVIRWCKHWKYIVAAGEVDAEDGLPNRSTQIEGKLQKLFRPVRNGRNQIWVQPRDEYDFDGWSIDNKPLYVRNERKYENNLTAVVSSCMQFGYRMSLQLHKLAGLP